MKILYFVSIQQCEKLRLLANVN